MLMLLTVSAIESCNDLNQLILLQEALKLLKIFNNTRHFKCAQQHPMVTNAATRDSKRATKLETKTPSIFFVTKLPSQSALSMSDECLCVLMNFL